MHSLSTFPTGSLCLSVSLSLSLTHTQSTSLSVSHTHSRTPKEQHKNAFLVQFISTSTPGIAFGHLPSTSATLPKTKAFESSLKGQPPKVLTTKKKN